MSHLLSSQQQDIIQQEEMSLSQVMKAISHDFEARVNTDNLEQELLALREQIKEARLEDQAALLEHMTRLAALRNSQVLREDEQNDDEFISSPYFGRVCYQEEDEDENPIGPLKQVFIGKKSFFSKDGRIKIVDWRSSPMSQLYYKMREGDYFYETLGNRELGGTLQTRRTLSVSEGELKRIQYGDAAHVLVKSSTQEWQEIKPNQSNSFAYDAKKLGGSPQAQASQKSHHLPEITALIDAEQFDLITHEQSGVVIIQGGAGTGKTTIALHRVAYLMYQNPKRFKSKNILILTPGKALQRYIAHVLPALNVEYIPIHRIDEWAFKQAQLLDRTLKKFTLTEHTPLAAQKLKKHTVCIHLMEEMIQKINYQYEQRWTSWKDENLAKAWIQRRNLPLKQRLLKLKDWVTKQNPSRASAILQEIQVQLKQLPKPYDLWVELLTDPLRLTQKLDGFGLTLSDREIKQITSIHEQSLSKLSYDHLDREYQVGVDGKALSSEQGLRQSLDVDDCMIILRFTQMIMGLNDYSSSGKILRYEHIMVDEAQDLSPIALQVLCACTPPNSPVTLAGDTAQRIIFNNGFSQWQEMMPYLPKRTMILPPLTVSYRSTFEIMSLARFILGDLKHEWATRDIKHGKPVAYMHFAQLADQITFIADAFKALILEETYATIAVVTPTVEMASMYFRYLKKAGCQKLRFIQDQDFPFKAGIDVCSALQIKGLEYDYVIALEVSDAYYPNQKQARHLLHVVTTRAAHQLWCLTYGNSLPSPLLPKQLIDTGVFDGEDHKESS